MATDYEIEAFTGSLTLTRFCGPQTAAADGDRTCFQFTTANTDGAVGHCALTRAQVRKLIAQLRALAVRAVYNDEEPDVWIVTCSCNHQWIWDRADTEREQPWGCSGCGLAPPKGLTATAET